MGRDTALLSACLSIRLFLGLPTIKSHDFISFLILFLNCKRNVCSLLKKIDITDEQTRPTITSLPCGFLCIIIII